MKSIYFENDDILPIRVSDKFIEQLPAGQDKPDLCLDALWGAEADDRLAAYRRGDIHAVALSDVLAKYQTAGRLE